MDKTKVNRFEKARQLVLDGKIRLHPGTGTATAYGTDGAVYTISKGSGCNCPDAQRRDPFGCKHALGTRALCAEYRMLAKQARNGETVRPSVALLKALGWLAGTSPAPVPAGAERDDRGVVRCLTCGEPLVDGRCPRQDARLRELGYGEAEAA
jgi:hypothetical protein